VITIHLNQFAIIWLFENDNLCGFTNDNSQEMVKRCIFHCTKISEDPDTFTTDEKQMTK